jgi:hypothetical protein
MSEPDYRSRLTQRRCADNTGHLQTAWTADAMFDGDSPFSYSRGHESASFGRCRRSGPFPRISQIAMAALKARSPSSVLYPGMGRPDKREFSTLPNPPSQSFSGVCAHSTRRRIPLIKQRKEMCCKPVYRSSSKSYPNSWRKMKRGRAQSRTWYSVLRKSW